MKVAILLVLVVAFAAGMDLSRKSTVWQGMPDFPLKSAGYTLSPATNSGNCKVEVCNGGRSQSNTWVTYADGPRILVCICPDAYQNVTGMAYRQGQVPIRVRSSVSTITAGSKGKGGGAWTLYNDIAYFGDFVPNVYLHESGHALDFAQGNMYGTMGLSGANEWHSAIDASACVPDPYAKTNEVEDWAQNTVARYWSLVLNKPWDNSETSCMKNQLKYAINALPVTMKFPAGKQFKIVPAANPNNGLTVPSGQSNDNTPLTVSPYSRAAGQVWQVMPTAYEWYIVCDTNSRKCLDNQRNNNVGNRASITYRRAFISEQHNFVANGKYWKIINRTSGLALSVGCSGRSGTDAVYVQDGTGQCLLWALVDA